MLYCTQTEVPARQGNAGRKEGKHGFWGIRSEQAGESKETHHRSVRVQLRRPVVQKRDKPTLHDLEEAEIRRGNDP